MMRTAKWTIWLVAAALALPIGAAQKDPQAGARLQAAINRETVEGDLKGAIDLYSKLAQSPNRAVAAKALVRMGQCQEKLGQAEARKSYERAIREFSDQKEAVAVARARLAGLGAERSGLIYRRVWAGPKVDTDGTVSPDGRYLSYVDWETGDLALHDFATGGDRRLTNKGTWAQSGDYAGESAISRDGSHVAYVWFNGKSGRYELRIAVLRTSGLLEPRRLFDGEDDVWIGPKDWSPDNKWLAVILQRKDRNVQIGLVSTQDGSLRVLKSSPTAFREDRICFSPDGKRVGFGFPARDRNDLDVIVMGIDGSGETHAVQGPARDWMMGWSPDGQYLLFGSDRTGSSDLWSLPIRDGKPQGDPELVKQNISGSALGITASGTLYLESIISERDIQVAAVDFNTGKLLSAPTRLAQTFIGFNTQPDWSPDGKYLAYVSVRNPIGRDRVLAIRSLEDGQVRELRPNMRVFNQPRWAPDGRSFVCQGQDPDGRQGIYKIDAATGAAEPVAISPPGGTHRMPQWSLDGQRIFYFRWFRDTGDTVFLERDLGAGSERELVRRKDLLGMVSPDGRYLVARDNEPGKSSAIFLIPSGGGAPRELLRVNAPRIPLPFLVWTPDARNVIVPVFSADVAKSEYWLVPLGGGQPRKLELVARDIAMPNEGLPRIHPDGRRIAYVAGERKVEVWVLENFLPAR